MSKSKEKNSTPVSEMTRAEKKEVVKKLVDLLTAQLGVSCDAPISVTLDCPYAIDLTALLEEALKLDTLFEKRGV